MDKELGKTIFIGVVAEYIKAQKQLNGLDNDTVYVLLQEIASLFLEE